MGKVYIIGVGQTRFFRHRTDTERALARKAVEMALLDAGLTWNDLQYVTWAPSGEPSPAGESVIPPRTEAVLALVPDPGREGVRGSMSLHMAAGRILSGEVEVAAAVASGKMADPDPADTAGDPETGAEWRNRMAREADGARRHFERYETTPRHLAKIASKNRFHASMNPRAYRWDPIGVDDVLREEAVSSPLTRAMCATPSDGAAAVIVCSERIVWKLGRPSPVRILASMLERKAGTGESGDELVSLLCSRAYEHAGVRPAGIDIAELDDMSAYSELSLTEAAGLCAKGKGGPFAWSGGTSLGGKVPVNTSGGMVARGDGGCASGLAQVHEIVTQLRGNASERQANGVRIGLAVSSSPPAGGQGAGAGIHIFQKA